jgi:hypothetical protein
MSITSRAERFLLSAISNGLPLIFPKPNKKNIRALEPGVLEFLKL